MQERVAELEGVIAQAGISCHSSLPISRPLSRSVLPPCVLPPAPAPTQGKSGPSPKTTIHPDVSLQPTNATVDMLRDLSLEASGGYIGASSHITMGRLIESIVHTKDPSPSSHQTTGWEHLSPKSASTGASTLSVSQIDLLEVPEAVANKLFKGFICHISRRWPFLQNALTGRLHASRQSLSDPYDVSMLHLMYAAGGRFLETTGETGDFFSENHYESAVNHLDVVLGYHDLRSVHMLLLLSIYSLRSPRGPGAWTYVGLAMRQCIDMGLHRRTYRTRDALDHEMRKRAFWCCYCLDRQVSIILGRPFAISDRDIDSDFPIDIDLSLEDSASIERAVRAMKAASPGSRPQRTHMSSFIHICKLRIIESNIQQTIYRVDKHSTISEADIEHFIQELDEWKASMPADIPNNEAISPPSVSMDSYDYYMVYYYKCLRFLLHPVLLSTEHFDKRYLLKCADTCGGVCKTYKKLHHLVPVGFSVMGLYSVFLAGLTLLYCTWAAPKEIFNIRTSSDMNACSIVLYIITERWPGAKRYRDVYETVKQAVLDSIENSEFEARKVISHLRPSLQTTLQSMMMGGGGNQEEGQGEVSALIADMAGSPPPPPPPPPPPSRSPAPQSSSMKTNMGIGIDGNESDPAGLGATSVGAGAGAGAGATTATTTTATTTAADFAGDKMYPPFGFNHPMMDGMFPDLTLLDSMDATNLHFASLADVEMPDNDWMMRL